MSTLLLREYWPLLCWRVFPNRSAIRSPFVGVRLRVTIVGVRRHLYSFKSAFCSNLPGGKMKSFISCLTSRCLVLRWGSRCELGQRRHPSCLRADAELTMGTRV